MAKQYQLPLGEEETDADRIARDRFDAWIAEDSENRKYEIIRCVPREQQVTGKIINYVVSTEKLYMGTKCFGCSEFTDLTEAADRICK